MFLSTLRARLREDVFARGSVRYPLFGPLGGFYMLVRWALSCPALSEPPWFRGRVGWLVLECVAVFLVYSWPHTHTAVTPALWRRNSPVTQSTVEHESSRYVPNQEIGVYRDRSARLFHLVRCATGTRTVIVDTRKVHGRCSLGDRRGEYGVPRTFPGKGRNHPFLGRSTCGKTRDENDTCPMHARQVLGARRIHPGK